MTKDKDRIETPDQWTKTIAEYSAQSKVHEHEGQKFVNLDFPAQYQGCRMILEASRVGKDTKPIAPFRLEYVLMNPFKMFDDGTNLPGDSLEHTGLSVADDFANKWIQFLYKHDGGGLTNKDARISWKISEGHVKRLVIELDEPDAILALNTADKFISGVLDYVCFSKEIPLDIHHIEVYEAKTNDLVLAYVVLSYKSKVELNEQLLSGGLKVPKLLVPLLRLFREATNSTNPYYRMLCLYRVGEGLRKAIRPQNNQKMKQSESVLKRPKQRIPENDFTKAYFRDWIGRPMDDFLDHVEHNFRKYIAHLIIDESFNWVPDPGTTKHAQETDKINSMLVSIIRQLIVDEWTFMQANRIE